jgi:hypothetical protein
MGNYVALDIEVNRLGNDVTGRTDTLAKQERHDIYMLDKLFRDRLISHSVSYRVVVAGRTVEMDTPEEVYRLLTATSTVNGQGIEVEERIGHPAWDKNIGVKFINSLGHGSPQITLIRNLYHHADGGLSLDEVLEALKMGEPRQLGGVLSGLAKNAKKLGFKSPVEIERTRNVKGQRSYIYRLEPLFRAALEEMIDKAQPLDRERDLPEFRDYIRSRRAALFGFMEQGAALGLDENTLT